MITKNKSLQNFYEELSESKEKGKKKNSIYTFSIYSQDKKDLAAERLELHAYEDFWKPLSSLSTKKRFGSFSILRSPRGDKKSQDQFHFEIFRESWKMESLKVENQEEREKVDILEASSKWEEKYYLS